jgi:hypothetical protein
VSRVRHVRSWGLPLVAIVLASGCGGPVAPIDVGAKEVPLDLLLGAKKKVASAPLPPIIVETTIDGRPVITTPLPKAGTARATTTVPLPTLAPTPCTEDPLAVPAESAPDRVAPKPIPKGTYPFRIHGALSTTGATVSKDDLDGYGTYNVTNVVTNVDGFSYDLVADHPKAGRTTTTYRIVTATVDRPDVTVPAGAAAPPTFRQVVAGVNGIYLAKIEGKDANGRNVVFQPGGQGALLARFPMVNGDTVDVRSTDGNTTMSYTATTTLKTNVDACGTGVQGQTVKLSDGLLSTSGGTSQTFTSTFVFGTAFGGIPLEISSEVIEPVAGGSAKRALDAIIDSVPKKP